MDIVGKIKSFFGRLKGKILTSTEHHEKKITRGESKRIDEQVDKSRGYAEAKAAQEKKQREALESRIREEEEVNVAKNLSEEQKKLIKDRHKGSVSLKKAMEYLNKNTVAAKTNDWEETLGRLVDVHLLRDGAMAAMVKTPDGKVVPKITASKWPDMFSNFKNLNSGFAKGVAILNLDGDENPIPNIHTQEVPAIIQNAEGEYVQTKAHREEFLKQIGKLQKQVNKWRNYAKTSEEAWIGEHEERKTLEEISRVDEKRADSLKAGLSSSMNQVEDILEDDRFRNRVLAKVQNNMDIREDMEKSLRKHQEELQEKFAKRIEQEDIDLAEEKIQDISEWTLNTVLKNIIPVSEAVQEEGEEASE